MNIEEAQLEWATCSNFPIAFSTIDCSHIASVNPANYGDGYGNRKNVHSVNVQVTCSSNVLNAMTHRSLVMLIIV